MRKELAKEDGQRKKFQAVFVRFGKKTSYAGYNEETLLLRDIADTETGRRVSDHLWFTFSKAFEKINLNEGMRISFEARIKEYRKGYVNKRYGIDQSKMDFKLSHPTKVMKVDSGT